MWKSGCTVGPFAISVGGATAQTNTLFPLLDLAGYDQIRGTLSIHTALTDAGDTLDVYLQSLAHDGVTWNDRAHFAQITGADTPAAATPELRFINLLARIPLEATEEAYESSGSVGGTRLPAGTVRNGPFPDKYYTGGLWTPNWRLRMEVVDSGGNSSFLGSCWFECS